MCTPHRRSLCFHFNEGLRPTYTCHLSNYPQSVKQVPRQVSPPCASCLCFHYISNRDVRSAHTSRFCSDHRSRFFVVTMVSCQGLGGRGRFEEVTCHRLLLEELFSETVIKKCRIYCIRFPNERAHDAST